jgi:DNA repair protein RadA/Sms
MKKEVASVFVCQRCGEDFSKWFGQCPNCRAWNSLVETKMRLPKVVRREGISESKMVRIDEVKMGKRQGRMKTGIEEFDRVLGGGVVGGSVVLVAGEPGIGKSTLLTQLLSFLGGLYVTGEESLEQVKMRVERLKMANKKDFFVLAETSVESILERLEAAEMEKVRVVVVDSVQTLMTEELTGGAGSVGQVRESAQKLLIWAKRAGVPLFLVGHVTKEGAIAGPKVLEHLVDTVLYLEGERFGALRLLRVSKNRFGPTDEVGVFEMGEEGMAEVNNPSKLFLSERVRGVPGSVVVAVMEGTRPMLAEIQALVVPTSLVVPRRVASGVDYSRLQMIVAVLTRRLGLPLGSFDVYVNVAGGLRVSEPAADLGMALAIASSQKNKPLTERTVAFGEVGLLGEIRMVGQARKRALEAKRLGFRQVISPDGYRNLREAINKGLGTRD